jgi:hypothetical protein
MIGGLPAAVFRRPVAARLRNGQKLAMGLNFDH